MGEARLRRASRGPGGARDPKLLVTIEATDATARDGQWCDRLSLTLAVVADVTSGAERRDAPETSCLSCVRRWSTATTPAAAVKVEMGDAKLMLLICRACTADPKRAAKVGVGLQRVLQLGNNKVVIAAGHVHA